MAERGGGTNGYARGEMIPDVRVPQLADCAQIDKLFKGPFTDRQGNFKYREWVKVLRINDEEETKQALAM